MRPIYLGLICAAAALGLASCDDVQHDEVIDGPYRLAAMNQSEDMSVCYQSAPHVCVTRVESTVFAVGFNKDYIVAARHPKKATGLYASADRTKTQYYYIVRAMDRADAGPSAIRGPLNRADFDRMQAQIGLPPLSHDVTGQIDWDDPAPPNHP